MVSRDSGPSCHQTCVCRTDTSVKVLSRLSWRVFDLIQVKLLLPPYASLLERGGFCTVLLDIPSKHRNQGAWYKQDAPGGSRGTRLLFGGVCEIFVWSHASGGWWNPAEGSWLQELRTSVLQDPTLGSQIRIQWELSYLKGVGLEISTGKEITELCKPSWRFG